MKNKMTIRSDNDKKEIHSRINRLIGQLNGIKKMVDENRYCDDILIQLSAIDKSIKSCANYILNKKIKKYIIDNIKNGNEEVIDEISNLFKRFQ